MKRCVNLLTVVLLLSFSAAAAAQAPSDRYDLDTPDKTVIAFFKAANAEDFAALDQMLSPRIKGLMTQDKITIQDYAKAWCALPVSKVFDAKPSAGNSENAASAEIIFMIDQREYLTTVSLIKIGNRWLWDQR